MGERIRGEDAVTGRRAGGTASENGDRSVDSECVRVVLEHPWRRRVLDVVIDLGVATMRDLATQIASLEHGVEPHVVTEQQRHTVEVSLYHVHVPKLAEVGVIDVDTGQKRVHTGPNARQVDAALSALDSIGDSEADSVLVEHR